MTDYERKSDMERLEARFSQMERRLDNIEARLRKPPFNEEKPRRTTKEDKAVLKDMGEPGEVTDATTNPKRRGDAG
jgi:hypothetical protein